MAYNLPKFNNRLRFHDIYDPELGFESSLLQNEKRYSQLKDLAYSLGYISDSFLYRPKNITNLVDITNSEPKSILENEYSKQQESKKPRVLPPLVQNFKMENPVFKYFKNEKAWLLDELFSNENFKPMKKNYTFFKNNSELLESNMIAKHLKQYERNIQSANKFVEKVERATSPLQVIKSFDDYDLHENSNNQRKIPRFLNSNVSNTVKNPINKINYQINDSIANEQLNGDNVHNDSGEIGDQPHVKDKINDASRPNFFQNKNLNESKLKEKKIALVDKMRSNKTESEDSNNSSKLLNTTNSNVMPKINPKKSNNSKFNKQQNDDQLKDQIKFINNLRQNKINREQLYNNLSETDSNSYAYKNIQSKLQKSALPRPKIVEKIPPSKFAAKSKIFKIQTPSVPIKSSNLQNSQTVSLDYDQYRRRQIKSEEYLRTNSKTPKYTIENLNKRENVYNDFSEVDSSSYAYRENRFEDQNSLSMLKKIDKRSQDEYNTREKISKVRTPGYPLRSPNLHDSQKVKFDDSNLRKKIKTEEKPKNNSKVLLKPIIENNGYKEITHDDFVELDDSHVFKNDQLSRPSSLPRPKPKSKIPQNKITIQQKTSQKPSDPLKTHNLQNSQNLSLDDPYRTPKIQSEKQYRNDSKTPKNIIENKVNSENLNNNVSEQYNNSYAYKNDQLAKPSSLQKPKIISKIPQNEQAKEQKISKDLINSEDIEKFNTNQKPIESPEIPLLPNSQNTDGQKPTFKTYKEYQDYLKKKSRMSQASKSRLRKI